MVVATAERFPLPPAANDAGATDDGERSERSIRILMVDADALLVEIVSAGLQLQEPRYRVLHARSPAEALALLEEAPVDLVVTEVEFPPSGSSGAGTSGVAFLADLDDVCPQTPVVLLTSAPLDGFPGLLQAVACIAKPPDMDYLFGKIQRVVDQSRESLLRGISLETFLQVLEVERKTCTLTVRSGRRTGRLYVCEGRLVHAESATREGKDAVFRMLGWETDSIQVTETCSVSPTISERLNGILMEYCVQKDHGLLEAD